MRDLAALMIRAMMMMMMMMMMTTASLPKGDGSAVMRNESNSVR